MIIRFTHFLLAIILAFCSTAISCVAWAEAQPLGIVIMHGKGSTPTKHVAELARSLGSQGYLVANLEMPWSDNRDYDVDVSHAEEEVESALSKLRGEGTQKVFVAGHSQGGLFALHFAGKHFVDGIIAIAPGGNVGGAVFREKLGESVVQAQQLIATGKGSEKSRFFDFEGSQGIYPIVTTPASYLSWFNQEGAMNMERAAHAANASIPILWIVAKNDYPNLRKANIPVFDMLPANPLSKLYQPDSSHLGAPSASLEEIVRWTKAVAH